MSPAWSRYLRPLFLAYLAITVVHIGWVVAHEPFTFDAWNVAVTTRARPITFSRFFEFWGHEYTHSNPRIGQVFAYLSYKLDYFAVIATPLAYVGLATGSLVLGIARWPRWSQARDLALWTFAIGALWFALPQFGKTLFCRAYCTNYVYTAAIVIWFLVPLRVADLERVSTRATVAYFVFGVLAGICNEHTGPVLVVGLLAYGVYRDRNRFVLAGGVGVLVGFAALFFAPGQGERYEGLANRVGMVGRMIARGVTGNLDILRGLLLAAAPLAAILVLVIIATDDERRAALRSALKLVLVAVIAGVVMALTIFASPKLGPRFYYVSMALLLAAVIAVVDAASSARVRAWLVVLAVLSSAYAISHTVPLYGRAYRASQARLAALEATPPGKVFTARAFDQVEDSWWFLGDDFRDTRKRDMVAQYFALEGVVLRGYDPTAPLGVIGARFVPHATLEGGAPIDSVGGLAIGNPKGFDLQALRHEIEIGVALLEDRHVDVRKLDVTVEIDPPPPLPRLVVAEWTSATGVEMHIGRIDRQGRSRTRVVRVPKALAVPDVQIKAYEVGGEIRDLGAGNSAALTYVPWASGIYWILACRKDACFVIAATRHSA